MFKTPQLIAEIGCNHKGDFSIAKNLIVMAKQAGAHFAKFQKRNNIELLTPEQYHAPHPNLSNAYGNTYGEHREFLEFTTDQHAELKNFAESQGIGYSTSVWDVTSAKEIIQITPEFLKVPSACNNHLELLRVLRDDYLGDVHISMGMTTQEEEREIVSFFLDTGQANRLVIYSCTSGYPVPFEDICLLEISRIKERYQNAVKDIGFSGHHLGIAADIAAYTLGASWIERHFTKDRTWKGTDHAASLEFAGLQKLARDLSAVHKALRPKASEILDIEKIQRDKLKFRA